MLRVQKFGGSSLRTAVHMKRVASRVAEVVQNGDQCVLVVSAMGDTTDELIDLAKQITEKPSPREMDMLVTTGEQVSVALMAMALQAAGIASRSFTGGQAGIQTEPVHGKARIAKIEASKVQEALNEGCVAVVAGFQGITEEGEIATLGRGGSDTTAVALAAAVGADLCEIFTDVEGVYSTDPRMVKAATKLNQISYDEMLELANLGAAVLHPRSVEYAKQYGVALCVRSSFNPNAGTIVKEVAEMEQGKVVRGIAHDLNVAKIALVGVPTRIDNLQKVFNSLAKRSVNVDVIVQSIVKSSESDISFTIHSEDLSSALEVLEELQPQLGVKEIYHETDLAKVSIVGAGMISNPGVAAKMFDILSDAGIIIQMVSTSEIKVSCVIAAHSCETAVQTLHTQFGLDTQVEAVVAQ